MATDVLPFSSVPLQRVRQVAVPTTAPQLAWMRSYIQAIVLGDVVALTIAWMVGVRVRFGDEGAQLAGLSYYAVAVLVVVAWMATLTLSRCYESRFLGSGTE